MTRRFNSLVVAAVLGTSTLATVSAEACGGRGGSPARRGGSFGISYGRGGSYGFGGYAPAPRVRTAPVYRPAVSYQPTPQPVVRYQPAPAPVVTPPVATVTRPAPAVAAPPAPMAESPVSPSDQSAEASALQMLASLNDSAAPPTIPEFSAATDSNAMPHVGTWTVNLPGNQSVTLQLDASGRFSWTATKAGQSSTFQGQYRLEQGKLTLVRDNDLQQMKGSWTGQGSSFTFTLDGTNNGGLCFQRS
ncbi:MAG: hypothetical protein AAGA03_06560 [Planctomycetota bacterium]